jgi:hypothetical protein
MSFQKKKRTAVFWTIPLGPSGMWFCGSGLLPSNKLTVRPCQMGGERLVSTINWSFSGSMLIYQRVYFIIVLIFNHINRDHAD